MLANPYQNQSAVIAQSMAGAFSNHHLQSSLQINKAQQSFDETALVEKNGAITQIPNEFIGDYEQMVQEQRLSIFFEKFKQNVQEAMTDAGDISKLYEIYQSYIAEIDKKLKQDQQEAEEELQKLSKENENNIKKINESFEEALEVKRVESLETSEMIKKARLELEKAQNKKTNDLKEFEEKLSHLSKKTNQQIEEARKKANQAGSNYYEIFEIQDRAELQKKSIINNYQGLESVNDKIIAEKEKEFDELLKIQKNLAKQDSARVSEDSLQFKLKLKQQSQAYSFLREQIHKKILQIQQFQEISQRELVKLFEYFVKKFQGNAVNDNAPNSKNHPSFKTPNPPKISTEEIARINEKGDGNAIQSTTSISQSKLPTKARLITQDQLAPPRKLSGNKTPKYFSRSRYL